MPRDTSGPSTLHFNRESERVGDPPPALRASLETAPDLGAALKIVREFRGLSLEDVAEKTRIRRAYIAAIEDMRLDELPSRPFTIGYVRAYATALGLDGEAAVQRFKADEPQFEEPLRAPVGVAKASDPRLTALVVGGLLIIGAIVTWNIAQRSMAEKAPPPPAVRPTAAAAPAAPPGPVSLGAPLPAPVESTTPPEYETPGLAEATAANGSVDAANARKPASPNVAPPPPAPAVFTPEGQVFGQAQGASPMILQARKSTSLIVRGAGGQVYFARQLASGEAYRVPAVAGVSAEAVEPHALQIFVAGQSKGFVPVGVSPVARLVPGE